MSKLRDVVKNDVVKKAVYDKLVAKLNNTDTSALVLKTKYQTDKTKLEKKISDVTDFVKKTKLTELENKIPDISSLATKTALTAVGNKKFNFFLFVFWTHLLYSLQTHGEKMMLK